jgi:hypothetical protein
VQADGVQPISRVKVDIADLREKCARGMGFGYRELLERPPRPQNQIENDKSVDGSVDIAGSDGTFFDKRGLPFGVPSRDSQEFKGHLFCTLNLP